MPTLTPYTVSSAIDAFLKSADAAAARSVLGLGSAAVFSALSFEAAGAVSAHASVTSGVHGISSFGATLVDDADAAAARATLGLGTASTSTLGSLLSDLTYTASSRILSSTSTGASATLTLADGTNPGLMASADYTKLNTIPTQRAVARNTGSTGAAEQVTISQMLDWISGTPASGDLIYRSSGSYARLAKGTTNGGLLYIDTVTPIPTWSTKWTLDSTGTLTGATGSLSGGSVPALAITQTWSNAATTFKAFTIAVTDSNSASGSLLLQVSGGASGTTNILSGRKDGLVVVGASGGIYDYGSGQMGIGGANANQYYLAAAGLQIVGTSKYIGWTSSVGGSIDSAFFRDAANSIAVRNSTNAQSFAIYNTYTSSSNYERLRIYGTDAASFTIAAERDATPTGSYRGIDIATGGSNSLSIDTNGNVYPARSASTGMTNGFIYIPSAAGIPSGTPTSVTGHLPMYYDSTNNKFYVYNGAWKSVVLA